MDEVWDDYLGGHYDFSKELKQKDDYKKYFKKNFITLLPKNKEAKILEIGFGNGFFLEAMQDNGYNNFTGIEIGAAQYEFVKKNITNKVFLVKDTFKFLKENPEKFDAIVLIEVIEHIPKQRVIELVKLVNSSLKKKGIVIIKVPNISNPLMLRSRYSDFTHEVGFTKESLYQILHCANFKKINVDGDSFFFSLKSSIVGVAQNFFGLFIRFIGKVFLIEIIPSKSLVVCANK
jgi:2-polyprenyl-3-methyl-5-hydroxy-6-metoxy-1,4-benzoquinol methylase